MKYYIQDFCCLCLGISNEKFRNESLNNPDNLTSYDKIKTIFLELSTVMKSDNKICLKCSDEVDSIYKFNKTCLKNINILNSYKKVLKDNQSKNQCDIFVNLNESRQLKVNIEPPESPVSDNDMICGTDFVFDSHLNVVAEIKEEIEVNFEFNHDELVSSCLDPEMKIKLEEIDGEKVCMNEMGEASEYDSLKPNVEDIENFSVPLTEELFVKEEENLELLEDHPFEVTVENSHENQETSESIRETQSSLKFILPENFNIDKKELDRNMLIHSEGKTDTVKQPFKCDTCGELFKRKIHLKSHMVLTHNVEKAHKCNICEQLFAFKYDLTRHSFKHTGEKPHKCDVCEKPFFLYASLKTHMLTHTGEKPHKCNFCEKSYLYKSSLKEHSLKHKCYICEKSFCQKRNLKKHMLTHSGKQHHKCQICGYSFRQKRGLNKHMKKHIGERPHKCNFCGKSFKQNYYLKLHMFRHTGEKPHKCNSCEKKFVTISQLKNHLVEHTGEERPYKCDICEMTFTYSSLLRNHVLRHANKKLHKCDFCDKSFRLKKQLQVHMVTHTHKCNICEKLFTHKIHLRRHMYAHNGEEPFQCGICFKSFWGPRALKHHMFIHIGEKLHNIAIS